MSNPLAFLTAPLARLLLSGIFLASAVMKILDFNSMKAYMIANGMPESSVPMLLIAAAIVEFAGGLSVLLGCWPRLGALLLIAFLIPVSAIFHDFWTLDGMERQNQMQHFMKNVTIIGGLLMVFTFGSGPFSVDHRRRKPS